MTRQANRFFDRRTVAKTGAGFAIALLLLYLVAAGIGVKEVTLILAHAEWAWLVAGCLSTLVCLACWGKAWQVVLRVADIDVSFRRLLVTYFAATFANYVTPLGQAGGEPFIAYVLSRDTDASYEESLASVVTADLLNLLPFFSFSAVGLSVLLFQAELPETAKRLAQGLLLMAVGVPALVVTGWRYRRRVRGGLLRAAAPVVDRTSRITLSGIAGRIDDLFAAFGRIARDRVALVEAVGFAYLGWIFFALPLYFAGRSLGFEAIDPLLVLFVVPASTLAGLTPSPGGVGGVEVALVALVVALTPIAPAAALAIALIYRLASYWFALVVGGIAALAVLRRT